MDSYVCRHCNFSIEIRLQTSPVGTREDCSPLNANAKVFQKPTRCVKKQGAKDPKDIIGKSRLENSTGKGETHGIYECKPKLSMMRAQAKEIRDMLDGKESLDQYDFN